MIYIEGLIGAGKTTLVADLIRWIPGSISYHEQARADFLTEFYQDVRENKKPSPVAFAMQFRVMTDRFRHHCEGWQYEWKTGYQSIHDRSISGDRAFVEMLHNDGFIGDRDYQTYMDLRRVLLEHVVIHAPQVCLFLDVDPEICVQRLQKRGRTFECGVSVEYERKLKEQYTNIVLPELDSLGTKIIFLNWNDFGTAEQVLEILQGTDKLKWGMPRRL